MSRPRQSGVVLLSVLLVLALLSALVWQLMSKHSLVIAQSRLTFSGDQALEYALGRRNVRAARSSTRSGAATARARTLCRRSGRSPWRPSMWATVCSRCR